MMYRLNRSELLFTVGVIFQETTGFLEHKQYHKFRSAVSWPPGGNDTVTYNCTYLSIHPGTESVYYVNDRDVQLKM